MLHCIPCGLPAVVSGDPHGLPHRTCPRAAMRRIGVLFFWRRNRARTDFGAMWKEERRTFNGPAQFKSLELRRKTGFAPKTTAFSGRLITRG